MFCWLMEAIHVYLLVRCILTALDKHWALSEPRLGGSSVRCKREWGRASHDDRELGWQRLQDFCDWQGGLLSTPFVLSSRFFATRPMAKELEQSILGATCILQASQ